MLDSVRLRALVVTSIPENTTEAPSATTAPASGVSVPGLRTTRIPAKPARMASQRRRSTFSPNRGTARIVANTGAAKARAVTRASGAMPSAKK